MHKSIQLTAIAMIFASALPLFVGAAPNQTSTNPSTNQATVTTYAQGSPGVSPPSVPAQTTTTTTSVPVQTAPSSAPQQTVPTSVPAQTTTTTTSVPVQTAPPSAPVQTTPPATPPENPPSYYYPRSYLPPSADIMPGQTESSNIYKANQHR